MKKSKALKQILIVLMLFAMLFAAGAVTAYAEPDDENPITEYTDPEPQTEPPTEPETEPQTEPETEPQTEPQTEPETDPQTESETTLPQTQAQTDFDDGDADSQDDNDDSNLPTVSSSEIQIPTAIGSTAENPVTNTAAGIISWICVGVGVAVITGILLSTKSNERKNGGKQRYGSGNKITGKKRLLSDEYYQNSKKH